MITGLFGVPGCGKTTIATKIAQSDLRHQKWPSWLARLKKVKQYKHIYTNFECEGCEKIEWDNLKKYKTYDSHIILDELILDADNRNFKQFDPRIRDFLVYHRHLGNDITYLTQAYDKVDAKIRALTQDLWYISKSVVPLLCEFSVARRIYRTIAINELTSDLVMGYRFCNLLEAFFAKNFQICFRRLYYSKFDSFEEGPLESRSEFKSVFWGNGTVLPEADIVSEAVSLSSSSPDPDPDEDGEDSEIKEIIGFFGEYSDDLQDVIHASLSDEFPAFNLKL